MYMLYVFLSLQNLPIFKYRPACRSIYICPSGMAHTKSAVQFSKFNK